MLSQEHVTSSESMATAPKNIAVCLIGITLLVSACSGGSSAGLAATPAPRATQTPSGTPSTQPAPGGDNELSSVVLTAAEVSQAGVPVAGGLYRDGTSVEGQQTLDECGASYPSEAERVARIQTGYVALTDPHGSQVASNEVVRYSQGGAAHAYAEIKRSLQNCPGHFPDGGKAVGSNTRVEPRDPKLSHDQVTATQLVTIGKQKIWSSITFLYDGDLFSGVYVFRPTRSAALIAGHLLAAISTKKLATAVAAEGTLV